MFLQALTKLGISCFLLKFSLIAHQYNDTFGYTISRLLDQARSSIELVGDQMSYLEEDVQELENLLLNAKPYISCSSSRTYLAARKEQIVLYICAKCSAAQYRTRSENPPQQCQSCSGTSFLVRYK